MVCTPQYLQANISIPLNSLFLSHLYSCHISSPLTSLFLSYLYSCHISILLISLFSSYLCSSHISVPLKSIFLSLCIMRTFVLKLFNFQQKLLRLGHLPYSAGLAAFLTPFMWKRFVIWATSSHELLDAQFYTLRTLYFSPRHTQQDSYSSSEEQSTKGRKSSSVGGSSSKTKAQAPRSTNQQPQTRKKPAPSSAFSELLA